MRCAVGGIVIGRIARSFLPLFPEPRLFNEDRARPMHKKIAGTDDQESERPTL
jgi:hypothetical protein